jgi:hypothetical protein
MCVKYAAVIPVGSRLTTRQTAILQQMLIDIWTWHVRRYHEGERFQGMEQGSGARLMAENGHMLAPRQGAEGVWCRKCGKYVQRLQHVKLKITSKTCPAADLPEEQWLPSEGSMRAESRLDALAAELDSKYNRGGHDLVWNRKLGKGIGAEDEGFIDCRRCGRRWRWKDRNNNLRRSLVCLPKGGGGGVRGSSGSEEREQHVPPHRPVRRLRGKQPVEELYQPVPADMAKGDG